MKRHSGSSNLFLFSLLCPEYVWPQSQWNKKVFFLLNVYTDSEALRKAHTHTHTPLPPHTLPHLTHWLTCAPEHTRTHILSICVNWKHTAAHLSHMWSLTELAQWAECNIKSHSHTDTQAASFLSLKMAPFHNNRGQSGLGMIWTGVPALSTNEQLTPKRHLKTCYRQTS